MKKIDMIELVEIVEYQLKSFWPTDISISKEINVIAENALEKTLESLCKTANKYFLQHGFSQYNSVHYTLFLYYFSHEIGINAKCDEEIQLADKIYYLNKIMNGVDWYWAIELPKHFVAEHPLGTVLGRAKYGDYLMVYQGVTIGGSYHDGELRYPQLSDNTVLYANATLLGDCKLGQNVVISANSYVINETIPDSTIVFGCSPNLILKPLSNQKKKEIFSRIWRENLE